MAKKENQPTSNGATLGEISTIRDILMGQHINDFETKFKILEDKLSSVEAKLSEKIKKNATDAKAQRKEMSNETNAHLTRLEDDTQSRFAQLEQSLNNGLTDLRQMMEDSSMNDKERIGNLLMEAGKSLMKS